MRWKIYMAGSSARCGNKLASSAGKIFVGILCGLQLSLCSLRNLQFAKNQVLIWRAKIKSFPGGFPWHVICKRPLRESKLKIYPTFVVF